MEDHMSRKLRHIADTAHRFEIDIQEHLLRFMTHTSRGSLIHADVKEEILGMSASFSSQAVRVRSQFQCLVDSNAVISRHAFLAYLSDEKFSETLQDADIEIAHGGGLFDFLDADMGGYLSVQELCSGLMNLRGPVSKPEI